MSHIRRQHWTVILWVMTALLLGCSRQRIALRRDETPMPTPGEALRQDAQQYAKQYGVSKAEAIQRLQYQDGIGNLNLMLQANERNTFAGLWVEHEPEYAIVVRFTRDSAKTIRPYVKGKPFAHLVEVREADLTLAELEAIQIQALRELEKLDFDLTCSLNVKSNRVEVYVADRAWVASELHRVGAELPEGVELVAVEGGSTAQDKDLLLTPPVPGIAFPRQKPVEGIRTSMLAELIGTLHLDLDGGCLRVESLYDGLDVLPIWPPEYTLRVEGEQALVIDGEGQVAARVGQEVYMAGGHVAVSDEWVLQQIPQACRGEYFVVGNTVRPNLRQDSVLLSLDVISTTERTVLFLRHKPVLAEQIAETGSIAGELVLYDLQRCLRLRTDTAGTLTLLWPPDWAAQLANKAVMLVDGTGETVAQVGDRVQLRGRAVPHTTDSPVYRQLIDELPGDCIGATWVVDQVE
jgi:phosphohistidine phosphatase SixA